MESKYADISKQAATLEAQKEKHVKTLEEEIAYLNKHYEVEMGMLKDEIEILKKQL